MTVIDIHAEVFNSVYVPHLDNQSREQIFYGGSASGKSLFLAQREVWRILRGGRNSLVCRQVGRTVRGSVAQEIGKVITTWDLSHLFSINKTDGTITCQNGYQIIFAGLDDVEKLKSITPAKGVITDVWVEEATEANHDTVRQLKKRQRGGSDKIKKTLTLSFNPILQNHWIYKTYFDNLPNQDVYQSPELSILKTTYKDNRFLTPDDIKDLENETDPYFYNVYTLGNWGVLGDVIFRNWEVADLSEMRDQFTNRRHGLDFGFAGHPAAVICTHYDTERKIIYVYDELYQTGLMNDQLAEQTRQLIGSDPVTCDSAEPKSIAELQRAGLYAMGAKKGKDSVTHGIDWLKRQHIVIDVSCINTRNELQVYQWKKDAGGVSLPVPVDKNNHLVDALRYAYESESGAAWLW